MSASAVVKARTAVPVARKRAHSLSRIPGSASASQSPPGAGVATGATGALNAPGRLANGVAHVSCPFVALLAVVSSASSRATSSAGSASRMASKRFQLAMGVSRPDCGTDGEMPSSPWM